MTDILEMCDKPNFWRTLEADRGGFCQCEKLMTELFGIYYSRRVIWCTYDRHTRRCMINLKMGGLRGGPTKNWPIFETYDRPILTWDQMFYKFQWSNLPYARCMINLRWRSDYNGDHAILARAPTSPSTINRALIVLLLLISVLRLLISV